MRRIIEDLSAMEGAASPDQLVEACLIATGCTNVSEETRSALVKHAATEGDLHFDSEAESEANASRITSMLQSVVSSIEYQFA